MARGLAVLAVAVGVLLAPAAASACQGDPAEIRPITLTVSGEPATGIYTLPAEPPRGLVVFGHGGHNTSDTWRRHLPPVSQREGVIAVAMDYRGMRVTGRDPENGTERARGWPVKAGGEDLVAAAQHFDNLCPGLAGIILYGVSVGANASGMAAATGAKRSDGRPLFDYWVAIEGVHNMTETYLEARIASATLGVGGEDAEDIEAETGGPFETHAPAYFERTNVLRVDDIAASGLRGVVLVHAYEDGTIPYDQSFEMSRRLRDAGLPTDLYSVGGHGAGEAGTTIGSYAGIETGNAGHGWEGSHTHVVIQSGFDRLNALITRGEPAPCDRDFSIDDQPSNISPDPRQAPAGCAPDPLPARGTTRCRDTEAPAAPSIALRRRGRRVSLSGRAADRGCGRIRRVLVSVARREPRGRCRFVSPSGILGIRRSCRRAVYIRASGQETWSLRFRRRLPRGRYAIQARALDAGGNRGAVTHARFRLR